MTSALCPVSIKNNRNLDLDSSTAKHKLVKSISILNTCVKFHQNPFRNEVVRLISALCPVSINSNSDLDPSTVKHKLVQVISILYTCVKFHQNQFRNEVAKVMTKSEQMYERTNRTLYPPAVARQGIISAVIS